MSAADSGTLALIVRQAPYAQRDARAQLDVALAAAALEVPLEIYFLGDGAWQLALSRAPDGAWLPRGLKGWAAIAELTTARYFVESAVADRMNTLGAATVVPVEELPITEMSRRWRACMKVMSL